MQLGIKNQKTINFRDLMARVLKDEFEGKLPQTIDAIPTELAPAGAEPKYYDTIEHGLTQLLLHIFF